MSWKKLLQCGVIEVSEASGKRSLIRKRERLEKPHPETRPNTSLSLAFPPIWLAG